MSDYPQWRGAKRDGYVYEKKLLKTWPGGGPKLLWRSKSIGYGYGSPSIAGGRLFVIGSEGPDEFLLALDVRPGKSGQPLWKAKLGPVGNPDQQPAFSGARTTPTVDGNRVYALGSDGDLVCLSASNGKTLWSKHLRRDFGGVPGVWAYSESPLVDGENVVVTPGGPDATIVALNKNNGDVRWKSKLVEGEKAAAYASAIAVSIGGVKQYVQYLPKGLVGVEAKTGAPLWRYSGTVDPQYGVNAQTPVLHRTMLYTGAGNRGGLIEVGPGGAKELWVQRGAPCSLGGTVAYDGCFFGTNQRELVCVEAVSGKILWSNPCVGAASVCIAGTSPLSEHLLVVHGESGDVALVEATKIAYKERGRFTPSERPEKQRGPMERAWAYPVVADGKLYLREGGTLWAYAA